MCWNESVSLNTFIFSTFVVIFSYFNKILDIYQCLLLFSISFMQLIEFFIWRNINNTRKNKFYSEIAKLVLVSQPVFSLLTIQNKSIKYATVVLYIVGFFVNKAFFTKKNIKYKKTTIGKNGHLRWNWMTTKPILVVIYLVCLLVPILFWKKSFIFVVFSATLIASLILFRKDGTWGSLWCWASNFIALYLIGSVFAKEFCRL